MLLLAAAVYAPLAGAGWVWDDHFLVGSNEALRAPTWERLFQRDLWCCTGGPPSPYYRPLTTLSLLLDRTLWGAWAGGYHLTSVGLHLAAGALLYRLLAPRLPGWPAVAALAVFALHPIQSEAVAWVSARNDPLVALLLLAVFAARPYPWLAGLLALGAGLTKESGLLAPLLLLAWSKAWSEPVPRPLLGAVSLGVLVAAALRLQVHWVAAPLPPGGHVTSLTRLVEAAVTYLGWLVLPWPLTTTTTFLATSRTAWLAAAVALLGLLGLLRRHGPWLGVFALVALAPALGGLWAYGQLGERYLYLPMVGIAAWVGRAVAGLRIVPWVAVSVLVLRVRIPDWQDDLHLYGAAARRVGDSASLALFAHAHEEVGEDREALDLYTRSLAARPYSPFACQHVVGPAARTLEGDALPAAILGWSDQGCREVPPFADGAALALFRAGHRPAAVTLARTGARDSSGRLDLVRYAAALAEGDLLTAAGITLPRDADNLRERAWLLLRGG